MTEKELLDLLGDVRPDYIAQTEAFRRGGARPRKRHGHWILSIAAMLAAVLAAGAVAHFYLAPNWKVPAAKGTETMTAQEAAPAQTDTAADSEDTGWQENVLNGRRMFYSQEYERVMNFPEYTETVQYELKTDRLTPWRYAILDMDGDGTDELVVEYRQEAEMVYYNSGDGTEETPFDNKGFFGHNITLVFWECDGTILEKQYNIRQMSEIREDGSFYHFGVDIQESWAKLTGLDGNDPVTVDIPEDRTDQPEPDWHSFDGGDEHSEAGPSPDELGRLKERTIQYMDADNSEAVLNVSLFIGERYSIEIPQSGWTHTQESYAGFQSDLWSPEENPNVTLRIFRIYGDSDAAESLMFQTEQGWNFFPDKQGNLYGEKDGMVMDVSFYKAEVETFVIVRTYPQEAYEGWGRMLSVLEDTFSAWPTEVRTKYPLEESSPLAKRGFFFAQNCHCIFHQFVLYCNQSYTRRRLCRK